MVEKSDSGTPLDFEKISTFPVARRRNLVSLADLADINRAPPPWNHPEYDALVALLARAVGDGRQIIWSMGAHVIKAGLGPYVSDLVRRKIITHVAGNGAVAIHDFELAMIGGTSEAVAETIETGMFGMGEETGLYMNEAVREGAARDLGFGRSLGAFIVRPEAGCGQRASAPRAAGSTTIPNSAAYITLLLSMMIWPFSRRAFRSPPSKVPSPPW